jgi:aminodeoxyfutalosine synthase
VTVSGDLTSPLIAGRRLTNDEVEALAASRDIISLGMMADDIRRQHHGNRTTFLRVASVPIESVAVAAWPATAGEIRIVGTPASQMAAVERIREVAVLARSIPVSGFALDDLERLAALEGVTLRFVLESFRAAGLELVAEAPVDRLQDVRRSIEEVNISGLALARLTIHQLSSSHVAPLFRQVADLQRAVAVIRSFAPLPRTLNPAVPTTGYDDLRRVALARLIVDNIASIQIDWSLYGPKLAQVGLTVGADDLDGVSPVEDATEGRRRAPLEEIRRNIRAAGQEPIERNGRFEMREDPVAAGPDAHTA